MTSSAGAISATSAKSAATPAAIQTTPEQFAQANGLRLCHDAFGDPAAPPLLLIMGLGCQMISWDDEFCAQLADRGYRVIRFDNRDIGRSTRLDDVGVPDIRAAVMAALLGRAVKAPYTLSDMARDTVGLLDALGIERAHIVGASMGGAIAQTLAIEHPQRVRSLTTIMSTSGAPGLPPPKPEALAVLTQPPVFDREAHLARFRQAWKVLRPGNFPLDEARDAAMAGRIFERGLNPAGVARQMAAIIASGSRKAGLAGLTVPTLVVHGDVDPLIPLACGADIAKTVPGARLVVVEGMGHALPIPMWPQVIDAIAAHAVRP